MQTKVVRLATAHKAKLGHEFEDYWRLRRQIFSEQKGWFVARAPGAEFDCYDTPNCSWIIIHDEGVCLGGARILPTDTKQFSPFSYMIRDFREGLLPGVPKSIIPTELPESREVFEATRFFVRPGLDQTTTFAVYKAIVETVCAATSDQGGQEVIALMPTAIYGIFRKKLGFEVRIHLESGKVEGKTHAVGYINARHPRGASLQVG